MIEDPKLLVADRCALFRVTVDDLAKAVSVVTRQLKSNEDTDASLLVE